jgi:predicted dehydrogenase
VARERAYVAGYYHPGQWRKRLDFGTGTFGDMGCHILDPVYSALGVGGPRTVRSEGGAPNEDSWGLDSKVRYTFSATKYTTESPTLTWYDGDARPPADIVKLIGDRSLNDQGSIYIGTEGVLYSPYIADPVLLPAEKFADYKAPRPDGDNHYLQFLDACRCEGKTSTPFSYAGPLTETVLLGCLATRFPLTTLEWDSERLAIVNFTQADRLVRPRYRKGWEVEGL